MKTRHFSSCSSLFPNNGEMLLCSVSTQSFYWHTLVVQTYSLSNWKSTKIVSVIEDIVPACLWKWNRHGNSCAHKPWREQYKYPYHPPNVNLDQIVLYFSTLEYCSKELLKFDKYILNSVAMNSERQKLSLFMNNDSISIMPKEKIKHEIKQDHDYH